MKISKILAVFMATAMLFCAMSVSAFAATTYEIRTEADWTEVSQKVKDGDTLKLMNDVSKTALKNYEFHADVTIDLNNQTLTLNGDNVFRSVTFKNGIINTIEENPRTITGLFWINCEGGERVLNFENVTVNATSLRGFSLITSYKGGNDNKLTVNIKNSKFNITDPNNSIEGTSPNGNENSGEGSFMNGVEEVNITNNSQIKISNFARGFVEVDNVNLDKTSSIEMKDNSKSAFRNSGAVIEGTLTINNVDIAIENDNNANFIIKKTANVSIANSKDKDVVLGDNATITVESGAKKLPFVGKVNDNKYFGSLDAAVAAAKDGDTITLLKDTQEGGIVVEAGKYTNGITIDLNNHKYEIFNPTVGSAGTETNGMQLKKGNNITIKNGTITSTVAKHLIQNYCDLTLEKMTMDGSKLAGKKPFTVSHNNATLTLTNSKIIAHANGIAFDLSLWATNYDKPSAVVDSKTKVTGLVEIAQYYDFTFNGKLTDCKGNEFTAVGLYKQNDDGSFSIFDGTLASPVAKIGITHYATLSAAVEAVKDGETITLLTDNDEQVTVKRTVSFTLSMADGVEFSGEIVAGSRTKLTMNEETNTYSFVYTKPSGGGGGSSSNATTYYTVSFESNGGSKVASDKVVKNSTLTAPTAPTKENYEFDAWYTDKDLTKKFDFDTKITKSITLYAKWTAKANDTKTDTPATDTPTQSKTISLTLGSKNIVANGTTQENDVAPLVRDNRIMLPTRFVSENLGCTVHWDKATNSIQIKGIHAQTGKEVTLVLVIGEKTATVNGETVTLDCASFVENNRNYTPIRFIAEALGANVDWDNTTKQIIITIPA